MDSMLEQQAEEFLHPKPGSPPRLHFPAELEARFELDTLEQRRRQVLVTGIAALVLYDLFLFADYAKHPSVIWRCVLIRLFIATPTALLTTWATHRRVRAALRETLILASIVVSGGGVLAISYNLNRIDSLFSQTGFLLMVFFGVLVLRQQFAYCVATLALMLLEDIVFVATDRWMTVDDKVTALFIVSACILLTLMANFMMERQERVSFVHSLKEEFHTRALSRLNQKLTALSQVDGLTGLSNRRHFDEQFRKQWREAAEANNPISLLMVDIDHFKKLNDTYGHLAGDRVLIQMGQILATSVRAGDDLVARYGGEEFLVLLTAADHAAAHQVADGLKMAVCTTPMMPEDGGPPSIVTVSCGLATIHPKTATPEDDGRLKLVGEADLALYAAKRAGRNRVACRLCETPSPDLRRNHPPGAEHVTLEAATLDVPARYSMPSLRHN